MHIRSVTIVSDLVEAEFSDAFRRRLNKAAGGGAPGRPVDLYVAVFSSETNGVSASWTPDAQAEFSLLDPWNGNAPLYQDIWPDDAGDDRWFLSRLFFGDDPPTETATDMARGAADFFVDQVIADGRVALPLRAAFASAPRFEQGSLTSAVTVALPLNAADDQTDDDGFANGRFIDDDFDPSGGEAASDDAFFDDPAYALPDQPEPRDIDVAGAFPRLSGRAAAFIPASSSAPPAAQGGLLRLGVYGSPGDAQAEADAIARFSGDVAPADTLTITPSGDGYVLTAVGLQPSAERMLCARRKIEQKPCG